MNVNSDQVFSPPVIQQRIAEFVSLGFHRTGWEADDKASELIIRWLNDGGVQAHEHRFSFPKVETSTAFIETKGMRISGTPLYDGAATGAAGVSGRFATEAGRSQRSLVLLEDATQLSSITNVDDVMGAVLVTGDSKGDVLLRNAPAINDPTRLPVLQVARRDAHTLFRAASEGADAHLVLDFVRTTGSATNVVGHLPVANSTGLVVIMTPKSGWFGCAAERGGGLIITAGLAAYLAMLPNRRKDLLFLFTSGHELGFYGLVSYFRDHPSVRENAEAWVHLGASVGAKHQTALRLFSRDEELRATFPQVLLRHGIEAAEFVPGDQRPTGESREVFDKRFLSLICSHPYFHSPNDTLDLAVDPEKIARFGKAFAELAATLVL